MSAALIWIICVVAVVSLAIWLVAVAQADRSPSFGGRRFSVESSLYMRAL